MSTFYTEPATGASIATDAVGNLRFQQFKLDIGGPGASVAATGTVANGLLVDVSRIQGVVSVTQGTTPWTVSGGVSLGSPIPPGANIIGKVSQDTSPWLVSGGVALGSPLPPGSNTIGAVTQGTNPWNISGQSASGSAAASINPVLAGAISPTNLLRNLQVDSSDNLKVNVANTPTVNQGTTPWTTSGGVVLGAPLPPGTAIIGKVSQDTSPWVVGGPSPSGSAASTLNPFLAGAVSPTNLLRNLRVDGSDNLNVNVNTTLTVQPGNTQNTTAWLVSGGVSIGSPLPPGSNVIGSFDLNNQPTVNQGVLGNNSFWSVSGQVSVTNTPTVNQGTSPWITSGGVTVSNFPATQTIAGTTTANQGVLANNAYWSVSGQVSITNTPTVNQGTSPWTVSGGVSIGAPLPPGTNIIGKVSQDTSPWLVSGGVTVSNFPATQTIAGTTTANQGTGNAAGSPWSVSGNIVVQGQQLSGGGVNTNPLLIGGVNGTTAHYVLTDTAGNLIVVQGTTPWTVSGGMSLGSPLPAGTNIIGKVSQDTSPWVVGGTAASGSLVVGPPVTVAGADASGNVRTVLTDPVGRPVVNQGLGAAADGSWLVSGGIGIAGTEGLASTKNIHGYTSVAVFDERVRRLLEEVLSVLPGSEAESANRLQRLVTAAHGVQPQPLSVNSFAPPIASVHGIPFVMSGHPNLQTLRVNYTAAQTNAPIVTPNYNQMVIVTSVELTLDKAASVNVQVLVGTGTTVTPSGAGVITSHPGIDPGGGLVKGNGGGIIGIGADGDPLRITCSAPTGGSLDVVVSYFCIEG